MMIQYLLWIVKGKPKVEYPGFNCGCCGKWVNEPFSLPSYQAWGYNFDCWGLCEECIEEGKKYHERHAVRR